MKKLIFFSVIGIVFFCSCEKDQEKPQTEITSLADTKWKYRSDYDGGWHEWNLEFTSTQAYYTETNGANNNSTFTGRYTYDRPKVIIFSDNWTLTGNPPTGTLTLPHEVKHKGTITGDTMLIEIFCPITTNWDRIKFVKQ